MPRVLKWKRRPVLSFSTAPTITGISVTRGRVGTSVNVTITGTNFRNCPTGTPPTVTFGGVAATNVVVIDQFTITCTTPVGTVAGIVDVVVTVGCCG